MREFTVIYLWILVFLLLSIVWLIGKLSSLERRKKKLIQERSQAENTVKIAMLIDDLENQER